MRLNQSSCTLHVMRLTRVHSPDNRLLKGTESALPQNMASVVRAKEIENFSVFKHSR